MENKKSKVRKIFNKNKYNLILLVVFLVVLVFAISKIVSFVNNKDLAKYNNELIVIKNNDSEIASLTLKDLRKLDSKEISIYQNKSSVVDVDAISIEKILNKVKIDPSRNNVIEFIDEYGNKKNMALETVLEVNRVYIVYRVMDKPNIEFDSSLGPMFLVDSQQKDANKWIKNIKIINIK